MMMKRYSRSMISQTPQNGRGEEVVLVCPLVWERWGGGSSLSLSVGEVGRWF